MVDESPNFRVVNVNQSLDFPRLMGKLKNKPKNGLAQIRTGMVGRFLVSVQAEVEVKFRCICQVHYQVLLLNLLMTTVISMMFMMAKVPVTPDAAYVEASVRFHDFDDSQYSFCTYCSFSPL